MEPVLEKQVVEDWLSLETQKEDSKEISVNADKPNNESFARLVLHKPDSATLFRKFDLKWYHHELSETEFRTLQTIWEGEDSIFDVARAISNERSSLSKDRVERIRMFANQYPENSYGPLILNRRRWFRKGPYIADGNHRAIGLALHMFQGGEYTPLTAYIGYPTPIIGVTGKIRGRFHCLIRRI